MLYFSHNEKKGIFMTDRNDRSDFTKDTEERFSPDLVIGKKKSEISEKNGTGDTLTAESAGEKSKFRLWAENFFYHYKWHSIVALFLIFVIIFCTFQTCSKTEFDAYVLYAGGKNLWDSNDGDDNSTYSTLYSAIGRYVEDFDGDGNRHVSFRNIYLPTGDEIDTEKVDSSLLLQNNEDFRQNMLYGDYYICFISENLFKEYTKDKKNNPFMYISQYLPENSDCTLASEYGVYLSSTPLANKPGFKKLPENTVICFRILSDFSSASSKTKQRYSNAESTLRLMLKDEAYN